MKLAGFSKDNNYAILRDLTEAELAKHTEYTPIAAEARNRLKLFQILSHNFRDWRNYLDGLLTRQRSEHDDEMLHLDRLLLNYLTCAFTIGQHFQVSFQQRFRKDEAKQTEYSAFLERLCAASWAFAFFLDFRGYVQHRGLGIGHYSRNFDETSVNLTITHEAASLVADSRDWRYSNLKGTEGTIQLVPLLKEFHIQMLQSYAGFVVRTFFPELIPAAEFYGILTTEIQTAHPGHRMVFSEREPEVHEDGGKSHINLNLIYVPNDLFGELGISTPPKSA